MDKTNRIEKLFLHFLIIAVLGWGYEVFLEVVVYKWGFSDRGVLFGPYCPIYGVGAFLICLLFLRYAKKANLKNILICFVGSTVLATAIELAASYALEALIGSWPWQTYVDYAINFQGRIALSPSVRFGLGGTFILFILHPFIEKILDKIPHKILRKVFYITLVIFALDCLFTILKLF